MKLPRNGTLTGVLVILSLIVLAAVHHFVTVSVTRSLMAEMLRRDGERDEVVEAARSELTRTELRAQLSVVEGKVDRITTAIELVHPEAKTILRAIPTPAPSRQPSSTHGPER